MHSCIPVHLQLVVMSAPILIGRSVSHGSSQPSCAGFSGPCSSKNKSQLCNFLDLADNVGNDKPVVVPKLIIGAKKIEMM